MSNVLRMPKVMAMTGLGRSTIYALVASGNFPAPIKLTVRAVGWPEADIAAWLESRRVAA